MDKPFTVVYEDFKQELASLINSTVLPPSIIEVVLQGYLSQIQSIARKQYEIDKAQYEKFLIENIKDKSN